MDSNASRAQSAGEGLCQYLPIGSLTFVPRPVAGVDALNEKWTDEFPQLLFHTNSESPLFYLLPMESIRWIRCEIARNWRHNNLVTLRVYVLPYDVGCSWLPLKARKPQKAMINLFNDVDRSNDAWNGLASETVISHYDHTVENDSLFYIFNTLKSPDPDPSAITDASSNFLVQHLLQGRPSVSGLKTELYSYQRRSVAMMIQKEVQPTLRLDPRLDVHIGPIGTLFYYDREHGWILNRKREYHDAAGGILAETMGLGKTLICLATILQTKGQYSHVPPQYSEGLDPVRSSVGSLVQMAAAAANRARIPWKAFFSEVSENGQEHLNSVRALKETNVCYKIPRSTASSRMFERLRTHEVTYDVIQMCSTTLVVVPANLFSQWRDEIKRHLEPSSLNVFYLDSRDVTTPRAELLWDFDLILISRTRFELEAEASPPYRSPFRDLHFLRIIVDEGHDFSSSGQMGVAQRFLNGLHVERKWIVSGTPAGGLLGVEVGMAAEETARSSSTGKNVSTSKEIISNSLLSRRKKDETQEHKDLENLGHIVADFLQVKPWSNGNEGADRASWNTNIKQKAIPLRGLFESLVVRHRIEDVEADLELPLLHNRVVRLEPCYFDKISINLFTMALTANAVTSERADQDYMFHTRNREQLETLIRNLRQSGFYWTGFSIKDLVETVKVSRAYIQENGARMSKLDCKMMKDTIWAAETCINSETWNAMSVGTEMGMWVEGLPEGAQCLYSLCRKAEVRTYDEELMEHTISTSSFPVLMGASHVGYVQRYVDSHIYAPNLVQVLLTAGNHIAARLTIAEATAEAKKIECGTTPKGSKRLDSLKASKVAESNLFKKTRPNFSSKSNAPTVSDAGEIPIASEILITGQTPTIDTRTTWNIADTIFETTPPSSVKLKPGIKNSRPYAAPQNRPNIIDILSNSTKSPPVKLKSAMKKSSSQTSLRDCPLTKTTLVGTSSSKLSYLMDRISELYEEEQILVFYEGDHIAYYIAQALEIMGIEHLIYAKGLALLRRGEYVRIFNTTNQFRVMLMDLHLAAHGLHITSASRVFFVNPVWQPSIEAQAIKRAHRIGQTRPVHVETLVLQDSLEDEMLQRRKAMTSKEHVEANKSPLDDNHMSRIIKEAKFLRFHENEIDRMATLRHPVQMFPMIQGSSNNIASMFDKPSPPHSNPNLPLVERNNYDPRPSEQTWNEKLIKISGPNKRRKTVTIGFK